MSQAAGAPPIPFAHALAAWVRVALLSFGGPAGQIAVMHRILVEEKRWVDESRFLHALNYCMLLPGPEAQQLATYIGWLLHGRLGGLVAGILFILPGFLAILALSVLYVGFQDVTVVAAIFFGLKPAVMALVVDALLRIGKRALQSAAMVWVAAAAFVAIFFFAVPFPLIVLGAAMLGLLRRRTVAMPASPPRTGARARPSWFGALRVLAIGLTLWFGPVLALVVWLGPGNVLVAEAVFFSKVAVVTFGGAYSVLAYVAQQAVEVHRWLQPGEMLDGLGMAETTPGPLIQVVQFVGFLGAHRNPAPFEPMTAALLGSLVTTWVTFVPCFVWIFLGAPWIESLRGNRALHAALSAITAAIVGVILNLAVWFALHVLFAEVNEHGWAGMRLLVPALRTLDVAAAVIAAGAFVAMLRLHAGMVATLLGSIAAGAAWYLAAGR
jgi:chromate transporter